MALRVLLALRDAEGYLRNWRRSPLRDLLERLPLDPANLEVTASTIATAVDQLTKDGNVAKLEGRLTGRLGAMFGPRLAVQPTFGFSSSKPNELIHSVRLFLDAARRRGISDTSLGSANVVYLGLLLEALSQQRLDEQFVATLVALEEPEAHLHVSLQRHLFGYLLRHGQSLVLTTHSPHIAAVTPIRSFIVLRASEDGTIGASTAALPVSRDEEVDLERYIDISRAEVLFASAVARKDMLKRNSDLGKGRFAQRLAAHIAQTDLPARICAAANITSGDTSVDTQALRGLGTASYLFLALDAISRTARGTSLLTVGPGASDDSQQVIDVD